MSKMTYLTLRCCWKWQYRNHRPHEPLYRSRNCFSALLSL